MLFHLQKYLFDKKNQGGQIPEPLDLAHFPTIKNLKLKKLKIIYFYFFSIQNYSEYLKISSLLIFYKYF